MMENIPLPSEWEQFLCDVRDYFKASLQTSEYENASNMFFMTAAEATEKLLKRCEQLLMQCAAMKDTTNNQTHQLNDVITQQTVSYNNEREDPSYLDMTAANNTRGIKLDFEHEQQVNGEQQHSNEINGLDEQDQDIYDICHVSQFQADETQKVIISTDNDQSHIINDCPYVDLPAGHLAIHKSTKYGQLQRIEKRFIFDQSKKYYCGILNDWLLCYAEGPTAAHPSASLYLKSAGVEIEHWGEGKRRDICFQITTTDLNKKFIFQANNEVDAKEWIHAIEAAIRGDSGTLINNHRKLPTPPVIKKLVFMGSPSSNAKMNCEKSAIPEYIYEEPSPLYQLEQKTESAHTTVPPQLPDKLESCLSMSQKYDYDVPKCPPQPLINCALDCTNNNESETAGLLNHNETEENSTILPEKLSECNDKMDFQAKVKDVHNKLSSQLAAGPKKAVKKQNSCAETADTASLPITLKELRKQMKFNTPQSSPQKTNHKDTSSSATNSAEKSAKNWFLNRLNKSNSAARNSAILTPSKCKQSEKENLLNALEMSDNSDCLDAVAHIDSSNPTSPILKTPNGKSKVNMIINQFESSTGTGHMFSVEALASNALASFSAFCESNDCGNYEPIMTVSTPALTSFLKKV